MRLAKSEARKQRDHAMRNGKMDATVKRGVNPDFSIHERKTPSRLELMDKTWVKYEKRKLK